MKKFGTIGLLVIIMIFYSLNFYNVFAEVQPNSIEEETRSRVLEMNEEAKSEKDKYVEKYGSESYGMVAYVLHKVQIYSIPICFLGIAVGSLYQYIIGTRRLDFKHKGYGFIITSVTILVICQVLPLIYAIIVRGWRG